MIRLDAQAFPFAAHSFDVVILFEAIYYIARPERFVSEARPILDRAASLIVNPERADFNKPFSTRDLSAPRIDARGRFCHAARWCVSDRSLIGSRPRDHDAAQSCDRDGADTQNHGG
jgi:hypothetical protein